MTRGSPTRRPGLQKLKCENNAVPVETFVKSGYDAPVVAELEWREEDLPRDGDTSGVAEHARDVCDVVQA